MARVFVVGGGPLQLELIRCAKVAGHWVLVADIDTGAPGATLGDAFVQVSTIDEEGVARAAVEYAVDAVATAGTDQPLRAIARATAACGLPGMSEDVAVMATRKDRMRDALRSAGVPCPISFAVRNISDCERAWKRLSHPAIIKPADSSGSRGVSLIRDESELRDVFDRAVEYSRVKVAVLEEYVEAQEFSVETLTVNGECHVIQITEKETTGPPHFVEVGHRQPVSLGGVAREAIVNVTRAATAALGIRNGPTHTEVLLGPGGAVIVEVGARLGGDYITSDLVPLSTGVDITALTLELALGNDIEVPASDCRAAAIRYFLPQPGRIVSVEGVEICRKTPGVVRIEIFKGPGEDMKAVNGSGDRAGYVIAAGPGLEDVNAVINWCSDRVRFVLEP